MRAIKGTPKHLSRTGQLESFTYLMLLYQFSCNYACLKCFNINEEEPVKVGTETSLEQKIGIISQAKDLGGKVVAIAGQGEPTIHPDQKKVINVIRLKGMIPIVYSNGLAVNEDWCNFYRENGAVLVFSVDSLDAVSYAKQAGWNEPNSSHVKLRHALVLKNIERVIEKYQEIRYEEAGLHILSVAVNTTVSDINAHEVQAIKDRFGDGAYFICNPLAVKGNAARNFHSKILMPSEDDPKTKYKNLIEATSESGGPLTLGSDGLCGYSRWGISISPTGHYMTCAYTKETDGLLGNIGDTDLKTAFQKKHVLESRHYDKFGVAPCLVRDDNFGEYLKRLTEAGQND